MNIKSLIVSCTLLGALLFSSGIQAQTTISTHEELTIEACDQFPSIATEIPYSLTISETATDGFAITSGSKTFKISLFQVRLVLARRETIFLLFQLTLTQMHVIF